MKKIFILLMVLAMVASLSVAKGQEEVDKPDVITIMVFDQVIDSSKPVVQYLEKKLNIRIEWRKFPHGERATAIPLMIAGGGEMPDIFPTFLSPGVIPRDLAEKGIITTISDFMDAGKMPLTVAKINDPAFLTIKNQFTDPETGKIYELPDMYNNEMWTFTEYVRGDWMENVGITKDPETVEEFKELLRAFVTQDPNGNGIADEVGWLNTSYGDVRWMKMFTRMFGMPTPDYSLSTVDTLYWAIINHNEVVFAPADKRFKAMLIYLNELWEEGLIFSEQFQRPAETIQKIKHNNTLGAYSGWPNTIPNTIRTIREIEPNALLHAIEYPIDPRFMTPADRVYARRGPASHSWAISGHGKNTEAAVRFMDYIFGSEEFVIIAEFGIEGVHHELDANGNPYYIGEWAEMDPTARVDALGSTLANLPHEYRDIGNMLKLETDPIYDDYHEYMAKIEDRSKPPCLWNLAAEPTRITNAALKGIKTYLDESIIKFVIGTKPFSEWDDYVAIVYKEAGDKIEETRAIYQDHFDKYIKEFY